jgi:MYXO-CTERM domain-containing protein
LYVSHLRPVLARAALLCLPLAASSAPAATARACGATPPSWTLVLRSNDTVPASVRELRIYQFGFEADLAHTTATLTREVGEETVAVTITLEAPRASLLVVKLDEAIEAGASYTLELVEAEHDGWSGHSAKFEFRGSEAAAPSELGELTLGRFELGDLFPGVCGEPESSVVGRATVSLVSSTSFAPWADAATHQLFVDGQPAFGSELPRVDFLGDRLPLAVSLYAPCPDATSLDGRLERAPLAVHTSNSRHELQWVSTLPDGTRLTSEKLSVGPLCPPVERDSGAAEVDASHDEPVDAGTVVERSGSPGSCSVAREGRSATWAALLALLLLSALRRRRRAAPTGSNCPAR